MISPWPQQLAIEGIARRYRPVSRTRVMPRVRPMPWLVGAFGFFAFIPYPALPAGGSSAIQIGNLLTLVACAPLLMSFTRRESYRGLWILPALLAPLLISTVGVALAGGDLMLSFKTIMIWAISALAMTATQMHAPRYGLELMTGIALAALLHAGLGAYQYYCFSSNVFPFPEIYINPSFLSVQDNATIIARYVRRPFGLFPEPSAMSASLAPWVLLWAAERMGIVRFQREPNRWQRWLFALAAIGALALIIMSQSGHAAVTLASLGLLAAVWVMRSRATLQTYVILVIALGVVIPCVAYFGAQSLGERLGGRSAVGNSSWEERSDSLIIGLRMVLDGNFGTLLLGLGAGRSAPAIWASSHIDAIFSVSLTYVYEAGLIGLAAVGVVSWYVGRIAKIIRWNVAFLCILVTWLVGVTLTTSYQQLLPLWVALGWLTVWPQTCQAVPREPMEAAP